MERLNAENYRYRREIHFTNLYSVERTDFSLKIVLSSGVFNFDLSNPDGSDFRVALSANGDRVLPMWVAHWDSSNENAVVYVSIPFVEEKGQLTLFAFWGNAAALSVSNGASMGFLFYEDFKSSNLDGSKWSGDLSEALSSYGFPLFSGSDFVTKTSPLLGRNSWIVEAGIYLLSVGSNEGQWSAAFGFEGSENPFTVGMVHVGRFKHNLTKPGGGVWESVVGSYKGLEPQSYQTVNISYIEPEDNATVGLTERSSYPDSVSVVPRKVEGDTRISNVRIRKRESYGGNAYISWFVARDYDSFGTEALDLSDLYIPYELYYPSSIDFDEYGLDMVSVLYWHESSFGGEPRNLSTGNSIDFWISNDNAVDEEEIYVDIGFDRSYNIISKSMPHFDSGRVKFYNASKLSNEDLDRYGRDYWWGTTTSGWAAVDFSAAGKVSVGNLMIKAVVSDLNSMGKTFSIYGADYKPASSRTGWNMLTAGTFHKSAVWQSVSFVNHVPYRYFILDIEDTYGGAIKIQEWKIFPRLSEKPRVAAAQLRLLPIKHDGLESCFPKYIAFQGSDNLVAWEDLIPLSKTYTPFIQHYVEHGDWQRYSFVNSKVFTNYRLVCKGNWGDSSGRIGVDRWSIHNCAREENTYRILAGGSNYVSQVWSDEGCCLEDESKFIYVANDRLSVVLKGWLTSESELPYGFEDVLS